MSAHRARPLWGLFFLALLGEGGAGLAASRGGGFADVSPEKMLEARQHNTAGNAALQAEDYATARREFEKAYELLPVPDFLRSLAKVAAKQNQLADAIRFDEEYLRAEPEAADKEEVKAELKALQTQQAAQLAAQAPPVTPRGPSLAPPLALLGSGLALLVVGGGLGIGALLADKTLTSPDNAGMPYTEELAATYSRGKVLNAAAISFDVVSGVTIAASVGWLAYTLKQRRQQAAVTPARTP